MTVWLQLATLFGLVVLLIAPVVRRKPPTDTLIREHLLDRYIVTLLSGESFSGLLAQVDDRTVVLRDVTVMSANNATVDGELVLRRDTVAYIQRPS
jgi:small nuclear ribonucleoprotein (snRNP)-like protein